MGKGKTEEIGGKVPGHGDYSRHYREPDRARLADARLFTGCAFGR